MWMLKDAKGGIKYLMPNKTIKVGRKDADIVLENDSSISRAHASITVTLKEHVQTSEESSICVIKDINSKYGSFIVRNGSKLKVSKEGLELHHGDTLTFGLQNCTYSVEYIHFVTVISRLNVDHRQKLKNIMDEIGGLIIDFYNSHCTHLTATTAATTTKIISSLIHGIPIVGINYWIQVRKCIEENRVLPDSSSFVLSLQDAGVNIRKVSLKPNPLRKTLFQKKTFIFFTEKSCKEYREMIQQAGGTVKVHSTSSSIPNSLFSNNYIIMKVATNDSSSPELITFDTLLQNKMKEKNLRTVNETEIPLAIIYASLDQYCNPEFDFIKLLRRKSHAEDTSEVLALDTQDILGVENQNTKCKDPKLRLIPETNDIQTNSQSQQFPLDYDFQSTNTSKQSDRHFQMTNEKSTKTDDSKNSIPKKNTFENDFISNTKISNENLKADSEKEESTSSCDKQDEKKKSKSYKKQRETSESEEMNENIQQFWPSKKRSSIKIDEESQAVSEDFKSASTFKQPKSEMNEVNDNSENKADQWGFKKSTKKVRDFDLDALNIGESTKNIKKRKSDLFANERKIRDCDLNDLDIDGSAKNVKKRISDEFDNKKKVRDSDLDDSDGDESTKNIKKRKNDVFDSPKKEVPKSFDFDDLNVDEPKITVKNIDDDVSTRVFDESVSEKRNKKAETILEPEKDFDLKQIQLRVKPMEMTNNKSFIRNNKKFIAEDKIDEGTSTWSKPTLVKNVKREIDHESCGKVFKKKFNHIPIARMPLAEMTIWRPNEQTADE